MVDIAGKIFGQLTAVEPIKIGNITHWIFKCSCGGQKVCLSKNVLHGGVKTCGCYDREKRNIAGKRFNRLIAVEKVDSHVRYGNYWNCRCDCGNLKIVKRADLSNGKVKSCGCLKKEFLSGGGRRGKFKEGSVWKTKEYYRDWKRNKRENDPIYVIKQRLCANIRSSMKEMNLVKKGKTFETLGYTGQDLFNHLESKFLSGMNWGNRHLWHIDHIIPLASAKNYDDLIKLNQLDNLQPLWAADNLRKGRKIV